MSLNNSPFAASLRLLFSRRFGTFWFACLLANIGTWAQQVAQPWLLLNLNASSFILGLDAFAAGAPVILLTLLGGSLADRGDRRRVIGLFQSVQMLCPLIIVALLLTHTVQPWMIILLSLVVGVTDALSMPSFQSIVPSIVRREQISTAMALNSTQFNLSRILGPSVAGLLMASTGAIGAFAVSAASYLPFLGAAFWVLPRATTASTPPDRQILVDGLVAGVKRILGEQVLRGAILTALTSSLLCAPLVTFCPVLIREIHAGGVAQFSLTIAAFGVGGLIGAIGLLAVAPSRDRRRISSTFALAHACTVALAALVPWAWALPVALLMAGVAMAVGNVSANTVLQTQAPDELRGQAVSVYMLAMRGGAALGALLTGVTVSLLGVREALVLNAVLALACQLAIGGRWADAPRRQD